MSVTVPAKSIDLQPGSVIALHFLTWQECESILDDLGEGRCMRIAYTFYRQGMAGIEPDTCFYVAANADCVRSCQGQIDMEPTFPGYGHFRAYPLCPRTRYQPHAA